MSNRKPLNDTAGYVASLKTPFGYVMITDRDNGGDWIDSGEDRWAVSAFEKDLSAMGFVTASSLRRAREIMKDAREAGWGTGWIYP